MQRNFKFERAWNDFTGAGWNCRWAGSGNERSGLVWLWAVERGERTPTWAGSGNSHRSAPLTCSDPHQCTIMLFIISRAGYRSKNFDIDTLSSIPVPERYFFRYQFYEISFNKIYIISKIFGFIFVQLVDIYTDSTTHLLSHCTKEQNISNTINQCK